MTRSARRVPPVFALALACAALACATRASGSADAGASDLAADAGPDTVADADPVWVVFDLGADFSYSHNPAGPWRYGHTRTRALAATDFELDRAVVTSGPLPFWHPTAQADGYYPYVAGNPGPATVVDATGSWAARSHEVAMEGSLAGQYSVIQFAAPSAGRYQVQATFTGIHIRLSTTDVHVMRGDVALFDAEIDGYGGDPALHAEVGRNPRASFAATLDLQAGEILAFAVGFGANQTHFNDTTGLVVSIRRSP